MKNICFFLGVDGLDPILTEQLLEKNLITPLLRHAKKVEQPFLDRGWAAMFTGVDASVNNALYWRPVEGTYTLNEKFSSTAQTKEPVWERLSNEGHPVGVLGIPTTFPAKLVNGFWIASGGGGAKLTDEGLMQPLSVKSILEDNNYVYDVRFPDYVGKSSVEFLNALRVCEENRLKAAYALLSEYPDLCFFGTVLKGLDILQHFFWDRLDGLCETGAPRDELDNAIIAYLKSISDIMERAVDKFSSGGSVIIASDHGFCRHDRNIMLTGILAAGGFISGGRLGMKARLRRMAINAIPDRFKAQMRMWQRKKVMGGVWALSAPALDWSKSLVVPFRGITGVYVNSVERFPHGIVEKKDVDAVKRKLIDYLSGVKDPDTGDALFFDIKANEEVYSGPHASKFPDVLFEMKRGDKIETDMIGKDIIRKRKILPTSAEHMPGQGHIAIHATPAMCAVFDNGAPRELSDTKKLTDLYEIMYQAATA